MKGLKCKKRVVHARTFRQQGDTVEEVLDNIKDAIEQYVAALKEANQGGRRPPLRIQVMKLSIASSMASQNDFLNIYSDSIN